MEGVIAMGILIAPVCLGLGLSFASWKFTADKSKYPTWSSYTDPEIDVSCYNSRNTRVLRKYGAIS